MPTASAVVADMIDTAVGRTAITFRTLELWSNRKARVDAARARQGRRAGSTCGSTSRIIRACWPQIAGVLGQHNISIASVLQHEVARRTATSCRW